VTGPSDILDDSVGEIVLLRVSAHVLEGENSNRRFTWKGEGGAFRSVLLTSATGLHDGIATNRMANVLQILVAEVHELFTQLVPNLPVNVL
jgi:hypothetical protein